MSQPVIPDQTPGIEALEKSIIEALGSDAPTAPQFFWGSNMGGAVLRIDLADMAADKFIGCAFVHEAEAEPTTIAAMLRMSIAMTRGDFAPDEGATF